MNYDELPWTSAPLEMWHFASGQANRNCRISDGQRNLAARPTNRCKNGTMCHSHPERWNIIGHVSNSRSHTYDWLLSYLNWRQHTFTFALTVQAVKISLSWKDMKDQLICRAKFLISVISTDTAGDSGTTAWRHVSCQIASARGDKDGQSLPSTSTCSGWCKVFGVKHSAHIVHYKKCN